MTVTTGGTLRVLLVEDDDGDALLFEELLAETGADFAIQRASSVAEAQTALDDPFACAVLDLGLPDADGLGALLEVRATAPNLPVLVLTGRTDTEQGLAAVAAGAQDFLVKGRVDGEQLARSIRYAVERRRAEVAQDELRAERLRQNESARLERGLLPRPIVSDTRLRIATGYRPGRARTLLGGDFYDVVEVAGGTVHAIIGDVSGHDTDAAALGVCLRIAWRTLVLGGRAPDELLGTLEQILVHERLSEEIFATVGMVSLAPDRRSAALRMAGHQPPILLGGRGEAPRELDGSHTRPPLGLGSGGPWAGASVELPEAWRLLLYTDGLVEGRVGDGSERLGSERLVELAAEAAADDDHALVDRLIATAQRLNGGALSDDVTLLLLGCGHADG